MQKPLNEPRLDAPGATDRKPDPPFREAVMNVIEYEGPAEKKKITSPPPSLTGQFTLVANRYYFKERPDQEAFVDHGERLRTRHNQSSVAKAMLDLAESRGWDTIKVSGHSNFKQAVWLEASLKGMSVTGYEPTPQDQAALRTRQQEQGQATIRPSVSPLATPVASPTSVASPAPVAPVPTAVTPSDRAAQAAQQNPVWPHPQATAQQREKAAQLREAVDTLDKRSAIQAHPELARLYPLLAEAENFAKAHLRPENQPEFVEQIKERSLQELARGETLPKLPTRAEKALSQDRNQKLAAEVEP